MQQFIWRPYINYPPLDNNDHTMWNATVPIICFWIVEWHQSDRVKLQFGFHQQPPPQPRCLKEHHEMTMKQSWDTPYTRLYRSEHQKWRNVVRYCLTGPTVEPQSVP